MALSITLITINKEIEFRESPMEFTWYTQNFKLLYFADVWLTTMLAVVHKSIVQRYW